MRSNQRRRIGMIVLGQSFLLALAGGVIHAKESLAEPPFVPDQLIVLIARGDGAPAPEDVVRSHRQGRVLPVNLGVANPLKVDLALSNRARGKTLDLVMAHPDGARARLERYIVFTYPESTNLEAVQRALKQNPYVQNVGKNYLFDLAVTPMDPLFPVAGDPADYQWGSHVLNLPAAWDYATGHSYIGLIDTGLEVDHPDLRPFASDGVTYDGGNFRPQLSWDYWESATCELNIENNDDDDCVDELEGGGLGGAGHGTHVSGIVAGTPNNDEGVAGACWSCSIMMARGTFGLEEGKITTLDAAKGLTWLVDHGAQAVSMSFGASLSCDPLSGAPDIDVFCDALTLAERRDVVLTASPGNDKTDIEFPASDSRVLSIGGLEPSGTFWDRADEGGCPCDWPDPPFSLDTCDAAPTKECGSNYTVTPGSAMQDLVAPAKQVLSTFYHDQKWNDSLGCWDDPNHAGLGYDLCTGTSMSSPYVAAISGILRSINPLLSKSEIRDLLITNSDRAGNWDPKLGYGIPDAAASVEGTLGRVGGAVLDSRLTPLFSMYSLRAKDHFYTTFPQWGAAAYWGSSGYVNVGPDVPGYHYFPGTECVVGPCLPEAGASVYVFSTDRSPNGHPLVPLYRLSFEGEFTGGPNNPNNRETTYTTEVAGIEAFREVGYDLDGVEGYIYQRCTPEPSCIPAGAVRLYRLYNFERDDYAIFPESELAQWQSDGYQSQFGLNDWIGYVYENVDGDFDDVVDAFETLIGTDPTSTDSDCDGLSDGQEILEYPYSDPLDGDCATLIGEVGRIDNLTHVPQTVVLSHAYTDPVVLAQPVSSNGRQTSVIRITSVQSDRFTFFVDEAPNMDGDHPAEIVSFLVLEAGRWRLDNGTLLEVGKGTTRSTVGRGVSNVWQPIKFDTNFDSAPVVFSQVQSNNDPYWVKTRQRNVSSTGLQLALEEDEAKITPHAKEIIGFLAIEPSRGTWSGLTYEVSRTANAVTQDWFYVSTQAAFLSSPLMRFLASTSTYDDADNAYLRYRNLGINGVEVRVEEDTMLDPETKHATEVVDFLFIQGDGQLYATSQPE